MSRYYPERWFHGQSDDELKDTVEHGELVPAIRSFLVLYDRDAKTSIPFRTLCLLREAADTIEGLMDVVEE